MPTATQSITQAVQVAGSLVETYLLATPEASEANTVAFVEKNADLLVNKVIKSPILQPIADGIVNEIIAAEVPPLYEKQMQKLGGIPIVTGAGANPPAGQSS